MKPTKRKQRGTRPSPQQTRTPAGKKDASSVAVSQASQNRELGVLTSVWFVLVIAMVLLAMQNLSVPGLYYDEAIFAGLAKDFFTGHVHGQDMPGYEVIEVFGHPFPTFVQTYLGALNSWLLLPSVRFFGHTVPVLRASNLFWSCTSLLFFMLGTWRWLGLRTALIVGALLALDPTYFFLSVLDWGVAVPSFLCRSISFFLALLWWQRRQTRYAFLAAFFAGLGFFNKIDFAVFLIAVAGAGLVCWSRTVWASLRTSVSVAAFATAGFILGAGPMLLRIPRILHNAASSGTNPKAPNELAEKIHTMLALYDGSYFYRLMHVGGLFEKMYSEPLNWLPIFGSAVLVASVVCVARSIVTNSDRTRARVGLFLLVAIVLGTLGVIVLPGAVRIHHAVLIYPFPQLIIAFAASLFLEESSLPRNHRTAVQAAIWIALLGLLVSEVRAIHRTQELIRETGGRGRWSDSFDAFCRENKDRSDLTIVSLDWGFNEQLNFLTDGPELVEPFWRLGQNPPSLLTEPRYLYLVHPAEYSLVPYGVHYLNEAQAQNTGAEVHPYLDRQGHTAFYTIQFPRR